jgi:hypothetical protein
VGKNNNLNGAKFKISNSPHFDVTYPNTHITHDYHITLPKPIFSQLEFSKNKNF